MTKQEETDVHYFFLNTAKVNLLAKAMEKHHIFCNCEMWESLVLTFEGRCKIVNDSYDKTDTFNMRLCPFCNGKIKGILAKDAARVMDREPWKPTGYSNEHHGGAGMPGYTFGQNDSHYSLHGER